MSIIGLTCTNGRFTYLKRLLSCFLAQDYQQKMLLIYNNAPIPILMDRIPNVILINNHIDLVTNTQYQDVGSIYRDALTFIPCNIQYVSIMDDDDIFLPKHFSKAVNFLSCNPRYKVWKPGYYFYKYSPVDVEYLKADNNLEGSCVIDYAFLKTINFKINTSLSYNLSWLIAAQNEEVFFQDYSREPTFCCEYNQPDIVHSSIYSSNFPESNRLEMQNKINDFKNFGENDILAPWPKDRVDRFFSLYFNLDNYT